MAEDEDGEEPGPVEPWGMQAPRTAGELLENYWKSLVPNRNEVFLQQVLALLELLKHNRRFDNKWNILFNLSNKMLNHEGKPLVK